MSGQDFELTADELRVLRACAAPEMTIGAGGDADDEIAAFESLEARGFIARNQLPDNDYYWPTELGARVLAFHQR